jgi:hypothetical protein
MNIVVMCIGYVLWFYAGLSVGRSYEKWKSLKGYDKYE